MNLMKGYKKIPLSFGRQMVTVSASVTKEKNTIHFVTEVDITEPRKLMKDYFEKKGIKLSLTSYIACCLANVIKLYPDFNSFVKGKKLIILEDLTISVLIEKEIQGERVPEPIGICNAQNKTFFDIQKEIRNAQEIQSKELGNLSNYSWIRFIPRFLLKLFIKTAEKNIKLAKKYGKVCITAVGMYIKEAVWLIPHGSSTVLVSVGSINRKVVKIDNNFEERDHLCLTISFDHNIVDGAPGARFVNDFLKILKSGDLIKNILE